MLQKWIAIGLWLLYQSHAATGSEHFKEELHIRPLQDGRVYTNFGFKTLLKNAIPRSADALGSEDEAQHYTVFPLALGQVIREYAVTELHLSLNAGKWDYASWGYPENPSVGSGAELWAWMGEGDQKHVSFDARWQGLRNALAGLFCASLGELDERRTTSPSYAFQPDGDLPAGFKNRLVYASHPSEGICTENLTPFIKLLPCKSHSGIASLLNPHRLFDADWHGMNIRVLWRAEEGVELQLGIQAVFDPIRLRGQQKRDWSFSHLFDRTISRACPVADSSIVNVDLPLTGRYSIAPEPNTVESNAAVFDVNGANKSLDLSMDYIDEARFAYPAASSPPQTPLSIARFHTGISQANGRFHVTLTNTLNHSQRVAYLETPPWIIKFYLHTLIITVDDDPRPRNDILQKLSYIPTSSNLPSLFEPTLILPPSSTVHLAWDFDKTFLRYTEHPPDAQRGWDLPPAVLIPLSPNGSSPSPSLPRMYTNTLLVDLATPDFSMPYNVIIMTCTLITMIFGQVFNHLTREFIAVKLT